MRYACIKISKKTALNIIIITLTVLMLVTYGIKKIINTAVLSNQRVLPVYSIATDKKQIAVTFDAAWGAEDTDRLIQILKKYDAKATFFCVGSWLNNYPEEVKKLHSAGHIIANHSNSHKHINSMSEEEFLEDVKVCNEKIKQLTQTYPKYYRGPYGEYNNMTVNAIRRIGMEFIQWDCDSIDWKENITVDEIVNNIMKNINNGSILLFHNGLENTPLALEIVLEKLKNDNYEFVSLDQLVYSDNYYIDNSGKQYQIEDKN